MTLAATVAGPVYALYCAGMIVREVAKDFRRKQEQQEQVTDDITWKEFFFGAFVGSASLATVGVAAVVMTVVKAPLVFIGCVIGLALDIPVRVVLVPVYRYRFTAIPVLQILEGPFAPVSNLIIATKGAF